MRLETDRTVLRRFEEKDLKDLYDYCSQEGVGEMAGWKYHSNLSASKEVLHKNIKNSNIFAIENKENNRLIKRLSHFLWYD